MAAQSSLGIFESNADVGAVKHAGTTSFDPATQKYTLTGSGTNMWFDHDEFQFVWKRMNGDFLIYAATELLGEGVDPHRKSGVIIRETLEPNSRYIDIAYHGDGLVSMQYRIEPDSSTMQVQADSSANIFQLEKSGTTISGYVAKKGDALKHIDNLTIPFESEVLYVGLFVCAHNPDIVEKAAFSNVRITVPAAADFVPYRDYIGSRLEVLDIESGLSKVIYEHDTQLEAPNWSPDNKFFVVNSRGRLYKIPVAGGTPELIDTGFATSNNNDHGFSPDGKMLVLSHHASDRPSGQNSVIYTIPVEGGEPKQVTEKSPSYWHGWSPDGKYLIYTANRHDNWDIYRIPATGGEEMRLTDAEGLDDGSQYSADGKFIWFNSARSGSMEIWRMKADGSDQVQFTSDKYQNWFPHESPDGKHIVFLSYPPDVRADDHPYYKHVMLRLMPSGGGTPTVLAHLYGGQGTINVPSWSPDSKKVAFVSNSDNLKSMVMKK